MIIEPGESGVKKNPLQHSGLVGDTESATCGTAASGKRHNPRVNVHLWPLLALLGSLVSLCIGSSFAKTLFDEVGVGGVSALRIGLAAVMLVAVLRPWRHCWRRADLPLLLTYGLILGLMNFLFYESVSRIPIGLAIAIEFTGPLAVALWSSRHARDGVWVALAATGMGLLLPQTGLETDAPLDPAGVAFAGAAAVCWAAYIVVGQKVAQRHGRYATPMGMMAAAMLVVPLGTWQAGTTWLEPQWWAAGLVVALLSSAVPYALEMYALHHLPRHTFSILLSLEPVIGALAGWVILAESLSVLQFVAMACIMVASMGAAWGLQADHKN